MSDATSIIDAGGTERFLGNRLPPAGLVRSHAVYGDTPRTRLVPRAEWKAYCHTRFPDALPWLPPVHDQTSIGMCNASATTAAMEARRARQGLPYVKLSGGDLYGRINGGSDRGSLLEDGLEKATAEGVSSVATCPYLDWRKRSPEQAAERKRYRVLEAYLCPTFDHVMSAVILGFDLISGVMWYANYEPDQDGWLPAGRGQAGGHAVYGFLPMVRGSEYGIGHQNSWARWGYRGLGWCVFPERAYAGPVGGWWAVGSVIDEGGVIPPEGS